jgi:hypothetical protein
MSGDLVPERHGMRASHEDRDRIVEQLTAAAGAGRLAPDELDERLELALTARTLGELDVLLRDLPPVPGSQPVPLPPAKEFLRLEAHSGNVQRSGRWAVPRRMEVDLKSGNATLDLTESVIYYPVLDLTVAIHSGVLKLILPPGVSVDVDDVSIRSGSIRKRIRHQPDVSERLLIRVSGSVRSGVIATRGPRRGFRAWLSGLCDEGPRLPAPGMIRGGTPQIRTDAEVTLMRAAYHVNSRIGFRVAAGSE